MIQQMLVVFLFMSSTVMMIVHGNDYHFAVSKSEDYNKQIRPSTEVRFDKLSD